MIKAPSLSKSGLSVEIQTGRSYCEKGNHRLCPWYQKGYVYAEKNEKKSEQSKQPS